MQEHTWRVVVAVRVFAAVAVPIYGQLGAALARDIVASRAALVVVFISTLAEDGAQDPPAATVAAAAALVPGVTLKFTHFVSYRIVYPSSTPNPNPPLHSCESYYHEGPFSKP